MNRLFAWLVVIGVAQAAAAQSLQQKIDELVNRPEYRHGRWGILAIDAASGKTIFERNADQSFAPASVTKLYTCAAALELLGADHRFITRVFTNGMTVDGTLYGDLVLVASGDPTMGGRNLPDGTLAFVNGDHTYADRTSTSAAVTPTNPLAGLEDLARQVRAAGIRDVRGDIVIDDRLFDHDRSSGSGPGLVTPIMINDNVIDFVLTSGPDGVRVQVRPETAGIRVDNAVTIAGERPDVVVRQENPWAVSLRGTIPGDGRPVVRTLPVSDPAAFARALFIERLRREGVATSVSPLSVREARPRPPDETFAAREVARHVSAPLHEVTKVTLKVSHNLYASTLPALVAVRYKERTVAAGLVRQGAFLREIGVGTEAVSFAGGAGGMNADAVTPRSTVTLLKQLRAKDYYARFEAGLPVLGVDGTLADVVGMDSPARGQVRAKTGTLFWTDVMNGRLMLRSKSLAGTMTTKSGRTLAFAAFVNDVPLAPGVMPAREGRALGELCEILHAFAP